MFGKKIKTQRFVLLYAELVVKKLFRKAKEQNMSKKNSKLRQVTVHSKDENLRLSQAQSPIFSKNCVGSTFISLIAKIASGRKNE